MGQVPIAPKSLKHIAIVPCIVGSQYGDQGCSGFLQVVAHIVVNLQIPRASNGLKYKNFTCVGSSVCSCDVIGDITAFIVHMQLTLFIGSGLS